MITSLLLNDLDLLDTFELLDRLLLADNRIDRRQIADEIADRKWGFMTVLDRACAGADGKPPGVPLEHFLTHLNRVDGQSQLAARGGRHVHTPDNCEWGDRDDAAGGSAMAYGSGRR